MASTTVPTPDLDLVIPPDDDVLYEVVDGQVVEKIIGAYQGVLASIFTQYLGEFVRAHRLGIVVMEVLFRIDPAANLQRRPDVAFVSDARWPRRRRVPKGNAWDVVPDLAVEVVSPSNTAEEMTSRIIAYFRAGVQRVWVIYPKDSLIYIYESPTVIRVLQRGDDLDGGALLPGFRLPVADLFDDEEE